MTERRAVVLLSGGMDSATVLAIARRDGFTCHTLAFDYGQRHEAELAAAAAIAAAAGVSSHRVLRLDIGAFGGSALTDASLELPTAGGEGIPVTYVPARNTVFLACGLALAEAVGARSIFIGVNAVDYSGYPDCRPAFVEAFERLANLATKVGVEGTHISIEAPLLHSSKAEIVRLGAELGVDHSMTVSCYDADEEGEACGACDACVLRREGFRAAGVPDPTRYR